MTEASEPAVPWTAPVEPAGPAPGVEFAPHGPRIGAYLLDSLLLMVVLLGSLIPLYALLGAVGWRGGPGSLDDRAVPLIVATWFIFLLVVLFLYFPFFWQRSGQTPGMRLARLWVVRDQDGGPLTWRTALLRMLGMYFVSGTLYLGFIWVFIDKRRRAWHDLIAGTVVIRRP